MASCQKISGAAVPIRTAKPLPIYRQAPAKSELLRISLSLVCCISHSLTPPPDDRGDEPQADNHGNDVDSYDECIHIQIISHQLSSLAGPNTTKLKNHLICEDVINNASRTGLEYYPTPALKKLIQIRESCKSLLPIAVWIFAAQSVIMLLQLDQTGRETSCTGGLFMTRKACSINNSTTPSAAPR